MQLIETSNKRSSHTIVNALLLLAGLATVAPTSALAADTTEVFDVGATDFEAYLGFDGLGLGEYEKTIWAEVLLGLGVMESFSGYVAAAGESNEAFGNGGGSVCFGIFGTPVDTDHFDLDLFLDAGHAPGEFALTPAVEINLDAEPDLALFGFYLRAEEALTGRDDSEPDDLSTPAVDESNEQYTLTPSTGLTAGAYWTLGEIHQLLLEYDMAFHHEQGETELGAVALGYNLMIFEPLELITQLSFDIPNSGEDASLGLMVGLIGTMPSAAP